ncbi:MAG: hypothetical protein IKK43_03700 [Clostridia bacterium]|nr:hypothetical protein [Clostridia bacterium]
MEKVLELNLEKNNEIILTEESKNIFENIGDAFSNAVNKIGELIEIPDKYKDVVKDGIKKFDFKGIANDVTETALKSGMKSMGMKVSTFNDIKGILEAIKEGDLKKGLSEGIDLAVSAFKIPTSVKNTIKSGKNLILDRAFEDELKTVMEKQKNTISRINKKCIQIEKAFSENDEKTIDRVSKTLKTDLNKVMPIEDVIQRGKQILNECELYKNKNNKQLSQFEIELCQKLA